MSQIIENVQMYGDFDMPYVVFSMLATEGAGKKVITSLVKEAEEIFKDTDDVEKARTYLFTWGFTKLKTISLNGIDLFFR